MPSRFIIAFLKRSKHLSFNKHLAAVTVHSDSGAKKIKSVTVSTFSPSIFREMMGPDAHAHNVSFLNVEF